MRTLLLALCLLSLSGCANLAQNLFDMIAEDACYPGNTPEEERACADRVDQNSRDHAN
jgi:hypothetical protein